LVRPDPLGFGKCAKCPYVLTGTAEICFSCAAQTMENLARRRCEVCDHPTEGTSCGNPVCGWTDRFFDRNYAIAQDSRKLNEVIRKYKYKDVKGWAIIFARVLVGYLDANRACFSGYDLIVSSPTYIGGRRSWDHTGLVLEQAAEQTGDRWPFDSTPRAIVKVRDTTQLATQKWKKRHEIATTEVRRALSIPDPRKTRGKRILVYDDIFTDGLNLNEVARCLRTDGGATTVSGVTLARHIYTARA